MDIVFVNFDRNNRPYGLLGYFWSLHNFLRDANDPDLKYSNQSLSFYMDSETLYLTKDANGNLTDQGLKEQISTLGHELTHMINFYQRSVLMYESSTGRDFSFDTFLEEMSAMMMEDWVSLRLDASFNTIRDGRFPEWLANAAYNCDLTRWINETSNTCFSYNVSGSFGGFLLRQYGMGFYQNLLRNRDSTDSLAMLDNAIRSIDPATGLDSALVRWGTSIALLPATTSPVGYAYPEQLIAGYLLPALNGPDYIDDRILPRTVPTYLEGYAHFPLERHPVGASYSEVIPVPPGVTLSVVAQ